VVETSNLVQTIPWTQASGGANLRSKG